MKAFVHLIVIIFFVAGCSSDRQPKDGLAFIDVRKNYPEKEIFLTDIADVTYLHLNSDNDDYLYGGRISYVTDYTVVVVDRSSGSILFFSKDGVPKSRFNHKGQGPREYTSVEEILYDETADEVFVKNRNHIILVYSSTGEYKRTISLPQEITPLFIIDFDDHSLFYFDASIENERNWALFAREDLPSKDYVLPFYRISKTDGEVLDYIELQGTSLLLGASYDGIWRQVGRKFLSKCPEGVLLLHAQTDTIFLYSGDKPLTPYFCKTPPVASLNPMEYLFDCIDRGQYQFIKVGIMRGYIDPVLFPAKYYMRNKMTGETVRPKLLLPDYKGKVFIMDPVRPNAEGTSLFSDGLITNDGYCFELSLFELKEADRENRLSGKLKELVDTLNEDKDNNVFMLVNFK